MSEAIKATFENRLTPYLDNHIVFSPDFANNSDLNIRWSAFAKKLKISQELTFPTVVKYIQSELKSYWEELK